MKTILGALLLSLVSSFGFAQKPPSAPPPGGPSMIRKERPRENVTYFRRELGAWWKNSKIAEKLHLTDAQIKQLEDAFYQHRLKLIDMGAAMEKSDMELQHLLNADTVNEAAVNAQVDKVLAARGAVEREMTMMTLTFRKILTTEQWKELQSIRGEQMHDRIFFRHMPPPAPGPRSELLPGGMNPQDCTTTIKNGSKMVQCEKKMIVMRGNEGQDF